MKPLDVLISCGEASGDLYASELLKELKKHHSDVRAFGLCGAKAKAVGMECTVQMEDVSVIGLFEVLRKLPDLKEAMVRLCEVAEERRPALAVLIDFSGFNLRLARRLKQLGIRVVYYVSPQIWAWRQNRIKAIRQLVEEMLVILPFEKEFYERHGVQTQYVGHPLVDIVQTSKTKEEFCKVSRLDPNRRFLLLVPGSRHREAELHLPVFSKAISTLSKKDKSLQFLVSRANTIERHVFTEKLGTLSNDVQFLDGNIYDGLKYASAAVIASGTATIEAALMETPMVVVYRLGRLSYVFGKRFVRTPFYSMVNLIAGRELVPELIQNAMTADNIVESVLKVLDTNVSKVQIEGLKEVKRALGGGGASTRAAAALLTHIDLQ